MDKAREIHQLLSKHRFPVNNEKRLQADIADVFTSAGIEFKREHRLDAGSIIDFMVDKIGIEIKIKGGRLDIYRQLERYAGFDEIETLILVSNVASGMPAHIKGRPVFFVNLARAWL